MISRTRVEIVPGEEDGEGRRLLEINAGETLRIPCNFRHDRLNRVTAISWHKDGGDVADSPGDRVDFGADGAVTIQDVQRRHEGNYRCTCPRKVIR